MYYILYSICTYIFFNFLRYTLRSFKNRDQAFEYLHNAWEQAKPQEVAPPPLPILPLLTQFPHWCLNDCFSPRSPAISSRGVPTPPCRRRYVCLRPGASHFTIWRRSGKGEGGGWQHSSFVVYYIILVRYDSIAYHMWVFEVWFCLIFICLFLFTSLNSIEYFFEKWNEKYVIYIRFCIVWKVVKYHHNGFRPKVPSLSPTSASSFLDLKCLRLAGPGSFFPFQNWREQITPSHFQNRRNFFSSLAYHCHRMKRRSERMESPLTMIAILGLAISSNLFSFSILFRSFLLFLMLMM